MIIVFFRKLSSLLLFLGCGFILYHYGTSDINSQAAWKGYKSPFQEKQAAGLSSKTLVFQAQSLSVALPELSESLAISALSRDPTSGRAATHLMSLYEAQGRNVEADQVAILASQLWPSHTYTRSNLADYWFRRNRPDKQIEEWNVLLTRDKSFREQLFPLLMEIVERDDLSRLIVPLTETPPVWWDSFFTYLSKKLELSRFEVLYRQRASTEVPLSTSEHNSYVARLVKERRWQEANDAWFIALAPRQMRFSGLIFDGGFESGVFNQAFGWRITRSKNPKIKPDITYGIKGRKALQVSLRKQDPINFKHVSQRLMLENGSYMLTMRYRTDTLKTTKGLSWRIRCIEGSKEILGESLPLLGSNPWSSLVIEFNVSKSCPVQLLRLESTSRFRHDHFYQGSAWFDDFVINAVELKEAVK